MADVPETRNPWKDLAIVVGLFLILFVLWVLRGGATKNSGEFFLTGDDKKSAGSESVLKDKVFLSSGGAKESDVEKEYIGLFYSVSEKKKIDATGWIFSGWFNEEQRFINIVVPKATPLFFLGDVNKIEDVILQPGHRVILTTGEGPVGTSFRVNKCSAYLSQLQSFSPELPKLCPLPREEKWASSLPESCRSFLATIPRCMTPFDFPYYVDEKCKKEIIDNLNYNACVEEHKKDNDFYLPEWRLYFGIKEELWSDAGGKIILRDNEGKIIDSLAY